ncbi:MAG: hypothetical protein K8R35_06925 [Bacteroidales bacterium]|nr:hypothetical protein [Bacteroidales bacterium]
MFKLINSIVNKIDNNNLTEEKTKQSIIEPILSELGWNLSSLSEVQREYKNVVDYRLIGKRITIYIEAKRIGKSLVSAMQQVKNYSLQSNSRPDFLITTNGVEWDCYSIRYALLLFSVNLKTIKKNDESVFTLISKDNVNNGLLMNYSNELKTQKEVLDYLKRNTNKIANEMIQFDSSFTQENIEKFLNAISKNSYIKVTAQRETIHSKNTIANVNQESYSNYTKYPKQQTNNVIQTSKEIINLNNEYISKVITRLKYLEKEIETKFYVRFGVTGEWNTPNYQVEDENKENIYTFYGSGEQKQHRFPQFNSSKITYKRYDIEDLEKALDV